MNRPEHSGEQTGMDPFSGSGKLADELLRIRDSYPEPVLEPGQYEVIDGSMSYILDEQQYQRMVESDLPPDMVAEEAHLLHEAKLVGEGLGGGSLANAVAEALQQRLRDVTDVAAEVTSGRRIDLTLEEVRRVQRDLGLMVNALPVALGVRSSREAMDDGQNVWFESGKKTGHGRYAAEYETCRDMVRPQGDYETVTDEYGLESYRNELGQEYDDDIHYPGRLKIEIDPGKRINFSYTSDFSSANEHYRQMVAYPNRKGEMVKHEVTDFSIRVDLDETAPQGLSLDVGRSEFESERFSREGDLVGRVMAAASPDGSHTYKPFTREMKDEFRNMAEMLIVHQDLLRRRVEETGDRRMPVIERESEADIKRMVRNNQDPDSETGELNRAA